jgi:magnesium-transporting ATPase (P-type)
MTLQRLSVDEAYASVQSGPDGLSTAEAARRSTVVGDPMEVAMIELASDTLAVLPHRHVVNEIPFDSERKRLSTISQTDAGLVLYCKGAPEVVLERCSTVANGGQARCYRLKSAIFTISCFRLSASTMRIFCSATSRRHGRWRK